MSISHFQDCNLLCGSRSARLGTFAVGNEARDMLRAANVGHIEPWYFNSTPPF